MTRRIVRLSVLRTSSLRHTIVKGDGTFVKTRDEHSRELQALGLMDCDLWVVRCSETMGYMGLAHQSDLIGNA